MDISKVQFLNKKQLSFLAENCKALVDNNVVHLLKDDKGKKIRKCQKKVSFLG